MVSYGRGLEAVRDAIESSEWSDISVIPTGFAVHLTIPGMTKHPDFV